MSDEVRELEMRIDGIVGGTVPEPFIAAIRGVDPGGMARVDPETGIVHIITRCDTLEIVAALASAGFEASAETM